MADSELIASLNEKELTTLALLSEGKTTSEVAELRGCSEYTVKQHIKNVFVKLRVNNRVHAVVIFLNCKHQREIDKVRAGEVENVMLSQLVHLSKEVAVLSALIRNRVGAQNASTRGSH